eukprot:scaffold27087_cov74-Phaeocystis_antarctica.AAC.1
MQRTLSVALQAVGARRLSWGALHKCGPWWQSSAGLECGSRVWYSRTLRAAAKPRSTNPRSHPIYSSALSARAVPLCVPVAYHPGSSQAHRARDACPSPARPRSPRTHD